MKALEMNISGIKCDNPNCDYVNMDAKFEEYDKWLNKPCPRCGANLLTEKDYKTTMAIVKMVSAMNNILPGRKQDEEVSTMEINMNGTGSVDIDIKEVEIQSGSIVSEITEEGYMFTMED